MRVLSSLFALSLTACGASSASQSTTTANTATPSAPRDARDLNSDATFGDLVRAARAADDSGGFSDGQHCLLAGGTEARPAFRLTGDVVVGVRPLPEPTLDFDDALAHDGLPVRVFSRWGEIGPAAHGFVLTTITELSPPREGHSPLVVFVTDHGLTIRSTTLRTTATSEGARLGTELGDDDFARMLRNGDADAAIILTAESEITLAHIKRLLVIARDAHREVAFAVPLSANTRLPETQPLSQLEQQRGLCPDGLPALDDSVIEGNLDPAMVRTQLRHVQQNALECMKRARSIAALSGGLMQITFRIGADGNVADACALSDEINDPNVRLCVLETLRSTHFQTPSPAGPVDVAIPVRMAPSYEAPMTPICE